MLRTIYAADDQRTMRVLLLPAVRKVKAITQRSTNQDYAVLQFCPVLSSE